MSDDRTTPLHMIFSKRHYLNKCVSVDGESIEGNVLDVEQTVCVMLTAYCFRTVNRI